MFVRSVKENTAGTFAPKVKSQLPKMFVVTQGFKVLNIIRTGS